MKRPWQIWLLFGLGLAVVLPAMGWLTVKALELDRAELMARRQAEFEEDVSRALWRMDSLLMPLLGDEAARPDFVYRSVYDVESSGKEAGAKGGEADAAAKVGEPEGKGKGKSPAVQRELSPLLVHQPQFVLLHFEIQPDGCISSPQNPTGEANTWAIDNGISPAAITAAAARMAELTPDLDRDRLLALLPEQPLPSLAWSGQGYGMANPQPPVPPVIAGNYDDSAQQPAQQSVQQEGGQQAGSQSFLVNSPPAQTVDDAQVTRQAAEALPSQQQGQLIPQPQPGQALAYGGNDGSRSQRSQVRGGADLQNRNELMQQVAGRSRIEQWNSTRIVRPSMHVVEGVSRTLWLGDRLILARRVKIGEQTVIQGCWLDWNALQVHLRNEVADLLPAVEFLPLAAGESYEVGPRLASIPVQLAVAMPPVELAMFSPIRVSLVVAWACLLLAAVAAAMTLQSVITLSERRGAFVSAVTHELRTPLTTFRMYAEMLEGGMVQDEQQRQRYLSTLRIEADRLSHLVENVLQYARLERGRPGQRREPTTVAALLGHCESRLADRAEQAEMKLLVERDEADGDVGLATDSAAVEQILFNLVDNACKYAAAASDKRLHLDVTAEPSRVKITVRDHGPGISPAGRRKLFQPFSKSVHEAANSAPGVGLGLALSRRLAHDLGGKLELESPSDGGAAFVLTLPR